MIRFACPVCNAAYQYADSMAGRKIRCGGCNRKVRIPDTPSPAPVTQKAPAVVEDHTEAPEQGKVLAHLGIGVYAVIIAGIAVALFAVLYPVIRQSIDRAQKKEEAAASTTDGGGKKDGSSGPADDTLVRIVARCKPPVALIRGERAVTLNGKRAVRTGHGSGFLIAPDTIVTNSHVIGPFRMEELTVSFPSATGAESGQSFKPVLLYEDTNRDLAVLRIPTSKLKPLALAPRSPGVGDSAISIGSPVAGEANGEVSVSVNEPNHGIIKQVDFYDSGQKMDFYLFSGDIQWGNSGGPLLNGAGEVVGVIVQVSIYKGQRLPGMSRAIPLPYLQAAIQTAEKCTETTARQVTARHDREAAGP